MVYILEHGLDFRPGATIHHLFQSHPHFDHHSELTRAGGVIARYDVKNVWDPAAINDTVAYGCFITAVIEKANATAYDALEASGIDNVKFSPDRIGGAISKAKNQLITAPQYARTATDFFQQTVAAVYPLYEKRLRNANAMDFIVGAEIYDHLEKVADRFDDVANEINSIVIEQV